MKISKKIKDRLLDSVITAFVFAAALAWREAFIKVLDLYIEDDKAAWSEVGIATIITLIVIILVYILLKSDLVVEEKIKKGNHHEIIKQKSEEEN